MTVLLSGLVTYRSQAVEWTSLFPFASVPENRPILSRRNIVALDGLRGLAIFAVMCCHGLVFPMDRFPNYFLFPPGWVGVDLFFVLSGFLITGILVDTRECANYFQSFYCRRILRIFPLYYGFLTMALLVFPYIVRANYLPQRGDYWLYFCYLMNWQVLWTEQWHANVLGHFWSLCVEEQFYLLWPLVVIALRPRQLLRFVAAAEVVVIAERGWWVWTHGSSVLLSTATITRIDGLFLGAACAVIVREFPGVARLTGILPKASMSCLVGFLGMLVLTAKRGQDNFTQSAGFVILALGFAALLLQVVLTDGKRTALQAALRWTPLTRFGKYAYGIYVFHVPIFYFSDRLALDLPKGLRDSAGMVVALLAAKFAASFGIASLSYNFFEKKLLAYKDRFEPRYATASGR